MDGGEGGDGSVFCRFWCFGCCCCGRFFAHFLHFHLSVSVFPILICLCVCVCLFERYVQSHSAGSQMLRGFSVAHFVTRAAPIAAYDCNHRSEIVVAALAAKAASTNNHLPPLLLLYKYLYV